MAKFNVRGWRRCKDSFGGRMPVVLMQVEARDGIGAATIYARLTGIRLQDWWEAGPKPFVVIRTEEIGTVNNE